MEQIKKALQQAANWKWSIAFLFQFVVNVILVAFWLGSLQTRSTANADGIVRIERKIDDHLTYHISVNEMMFEINANVKSAKENIEKLEKRYDDYLNRNIEHE
jgi:cell division protein FtsL